jgi:hypothetical protein
MTVAPTIPPQAPHGLAEILAAYGDPKFDGRRVDRKWEGENLITLHGLPLIPGGQIHVHKLVALPLQLALADCARIGGYQIYSFGCFSPRAQRGSKGLLSTHTWAIAVDINGPSNRLISPCFENDPRRTAPGARDIPDAWVAAFKARGFFWGGDFSHRFDPMHFQFATGY